MLAATYTSDVVRVKEKFQLTLPAALRKRLNITEGDLLEVNLVDDELRLRRKLVSNNVTTVSGANWYADYCKRYTADVGCNIQLTDEDISALVKTYR